MKTVHSAVCFLKWLVISHFFSSSRNQIQAGREVNLYVVTQMRILFMERLLEPVCA